MAASLAARRATSVVAAARRAASRGAASAAAAPQAAKGFADLLAQKRGGGKKKGAGMSGTAGKGVVRAPLTKGVVSPKRHVPEEIVRPPYAASGINPPFTDDLAVHDAAGVAKMRASCGLAARVLDMVAGIIEPGITTDYIDQKVHDMIVGAGAYPSPLNYGFFPKSVCTSLNECICHGIPDDTVLEDGDIINVDVTAYLDGYHGDTSRTFLVGNVSQQHVDLVSVTRESLELAIAVCGPGVPVNKIGHTIHAHADKHKLGVVREFVGHGVGQKFHCGPTVVHCRNRERGKMVENQTFTIEPMLTIGTTRGQMWRDEWTVTTADKKWTAQFEHTILITADGAEILTASQLTADLVWEAEWADIESRPARPFEARAKSPVAEVPVASIRRPLGKTRANDQEKVAALMASITREGQRVPIDVLEVDGQLYGFSGCHRFEAHQRLGKETILARVIKSTKASLRMHMM